MEKQKAVEFFGGWKETATAMGLTDSACRMWTDPLPDRVAERVVARGIQVHGVAKTRRAFPAMFERRTT